MGKIVVVLLGALATTPAHAYRFLCDTKELVGFDGNNCPYGHTFSADCGCTLENASRWGTELVELSVERDGSASVSADQVVAAVQRAAAAWTAVDCARISVDASRVVAAGDHSVLTDALRSGVIFAKGTEWQEITLNGGVGATALTRLRRPSCDSRQISNADIVINGTRTWDPNHLVQVLVHEMGHLLGLGHGVLAQDHDYWCEDRGHQVMAAVGAVAPPYYMDAPQPDDRAGLCALYPAAVDLPALGAPCLDTCAIGAVCTGAGTDRLCRVPCDFIDDGCDADRCLPLTYQGAPLLQGVCVGEGSLVEGEACARSDECGGGMGCIQASSNPAPVCRTFCVPSALGCSGSAQTCLPFGQLGVCDPVGGAVSPTAASEPPLVVERAAHVDDIDVDEVAEPNAEPPSPLVPSDELQVEPNGRTVRVIATGCAATETHAGVWLAALLLCPQRRRRSQLTERLSSVKSAKGGHMCRRLLLTALAVSFGACGRTSSNAGIEDKPLELVLAGGNEVRLVVGEAVQLQATVMGSDNADVSVFTLRWSSSAPTIVTVTDTGLLSALRSGAARITVVAQRIDDGSELRAFVDVNVESESVVDDACETTMPSPEVPTNARWSFVADMTDDLGQFDHLQLENLGSTGFLRMGTIEVDGSAMPGIHAQLPRFEGSVPKALANVEIPTQGEGDTVVVRQVLYVVRADWTSGDEFATFADIGHAVGSSDEARLAVSNGWPSLERHKLGDYDTLHQDVARMPVGEVADLTVRLRLGRGDAGRSQIILNGTTLLDAAGTNIPESGVVNRAQLFATASALGETLEFWTLWAGVWVE